MTELLSPFKESLSHFKKSCEGAAGGSSILGVGVGLGAEIGLDAVGPFVRAADIDTDVVRVEVEGVINGRTRPNGAVVVFPVAPTVIHAPPG